ncbi:hypothetical protein JZ751_023596 [Albula glossodonta]|uniref:BTB domain-containing protein n=1 Tax=Albula glossodonta TaxID=121402 RepID=A0A8T2NPG2_9TELE|nr:hypothetical protein JZ751_023596 [Albula glossodonta]
MSIQDILTINVGGQIYTTTITTLKKHMDSRLVRMLDGSDHEFRVSNGQVFVDRDGSLFKYILDYIRTFQVSLPADFSDFDGLMREAEFYELHTLAEFLGSDACRPRVEILELRCSVQESHGFFRIFCSQCSTLDALAMRISVFAEQPVVNWNYAYQHQKPMALLPLQRPSHHDMVFQCGTDYSAGDEFAARYVTIKPDDRRLLHGTNVLGLLMDTLLREGFRLISTRTASPEEKVECYTFERKKNIQIILNHPRTDQTVTQGKPGKTQRKR